MARRFEETVQLQRQSLATGFVAGALSLADQLEGFKQQQAASARERAVQRGAATAGAIPLETEIIEGREVTKAPKQKEKRFIGSIEINAHNRALRSAYLASLDNDNREAIAAIKAENSTDLIKFNEAISGYQKGVINSVDPTLRAAVAQDLEDKITSARISVHTADVKLANTNAINDNKLGTERAMQDSLRSANQGNALDAAQALLIANRFIDDRVTFDPNFTKEAGEEQKRKLEMSATVENIRHTLNATIETDGVIKAVDLINLAEDKPLRGFDIKDQDKLVQTLKADLSQFLQLQNLQEKEEEDSLKELQDAAFTEIYSGGLSGTADASDVQTALLNKRITNEQATRLVNMFQTRGQGIDDFSLIREIQRVTETNPEAAKRMIQDNTGKRLTEKTANDLFNTVFAADEEGSPLKTSDARRFKTFISKSVQEVGIGGQFDFDQQRRLARLLVVYDERVLDGESPAVVAKDLMDVNAFILADDPKFGAKEDLDDSLLKLQDAMRAGVIDKNTFNEQFRLIEELKANKNNIDAFNKAFAEAFKP